MFPPLVSVVCHYSHIHQSHVSPPLLCGGGGGGVVVVVTTSVIVCVCGDGVSVCVINNMKMY